MNLYLLRHGIAFDRDPQCFPDDSRRPLTLKGEDRVKLIGDAMKALELSFDHIFASPYLRASQTAELVAAVLGLKKVLEYRDELTPEGDPKALVRHVTKLEPAAENVLLVGHEPWLSQFISQLISGGATAAIDLKKGGLAKLEVQPPLRHNQCAALSWLFTPKQLAALV